MEKQWYVVNTYSGHEESVKEKLEMRTESMGMQDHIFRVNGNARLYLSSNCS